MKNECSKISGGVTAVYICNPKDFKIVDGEVVMKRKYGDKFKRQTVKYDFPINTRENDGKI